MLVAAAMVLTSSNLLATSPTEAAELAPGALAPVEVNHEWGELKEVIVGHGEELFLPGYHKSVAFAYDPKDVTLMQAYGGLPATEVEPENTARLKDQLDGLVKTLEARGIVTHRPAKLAPEEMAQLQDVQKGAMFLYPRDPMLVVGNTIFETALQAPMRFRERYALRPVLEAKAKLPGVRFLALPPPSPTFAPSNAYLEGGDVLLNGYDIYVGHSGHASNQAGREWLQRALGPKYRVQGLPISHEFEHLDCVMSLVRPGLGLLCKEAVKCALPPSIRDWEFIEVRVEEAKRLGCNVFVLDRDTVIVDEQHPRVAEELRRRKVTVIEIPYDAVARWNGGFRCSHHPLRRVSKLD